MSGRVFLLRGVPPTSNNAPPTVAATQKVATAPVQISLQGGTGPVSSGPEGKPSPLPPVPLAAATIPPTSQSPASPVNTAAVQASKRSRADSPSAPAVPYESAIARLLGPKPSPTGLALADQLKGYSSQRDLVEYQPELTKHLDSWLRADPTVSFPKKASVWADFETFLQSYALFLAEFTLTKSMVIYIEHRRKSGNGLRASSCLTYCKQLRGVAGALAETNKVGFGGYHLQVYMRYLAEEVIYEATDHALDITASQAMTLITTLGEAGDQLAACTLWVILITSGRAKDLGRVNDFATGEISAESEMLAITWGTRKNSQTHETITRQSNSYDVPDALRLPNPLRKYLDAHGSQAFCASAAICNQALARAVKKMSTAARKAISESLADLTGAKERGKKKRKVVFPTTYSFRRCAIQRFTADCTTNGVVDYMRVAALTGHASITMPRDVYNKTQPVRLRELMAAFVAGAESDDTEAGVDSEALVEV